MFPDDATAGGKKSLEALSDLPSGKFSARLVVRGVKKDEIEGRFRCPRKPGFDRGL
jgi:hypothetical protein